MEYRPARVDDAGAIARLHADSWRNSYRGTYSDEYLDGPVFDDRLTIWRERMTAADPRADTIVAFDGVDIVGFVHTVLDADPAWGALVDNLHVAPTRKGGGIGTQLMARSAAAVIERAPGRGLHLWVLDSNTAAQAFYRARGGTHEGSEWSEAPDGGAVLALRFVWPDPTALFSRQ